MLFPINVLGEKLQRRGFVFPFIKSRDEVTSHQLYLCVSVKATGCCIASDGNAEQPKYVEAMTHVVPGNPINKKVAAARIEFDIDGFFLKAREGGRAIFFCQSN